MRCGSESFLIKDSAFYQSKMTAALGVDTERVYEELRAHVWRSRTKGSRKLRKAIKSGRLSACIRRQSVADSTGLSVKTVQRRLTRLQEIGWIRTASGKCQGEASLYELGHLLPGGVEVFYADIDCRDFYIHLSEVAEAREEEVHQLPVRERIELAKVWLDQEGRAVQEGGTESPTRSVTESSKTEGGGTESPTIINNPSGERIDKSEECPGRGAPDAHAGPEPKHWAGPDNERRKRFRPSKKNVVGRSEPTNDQEQEEGLAEFALDTEEGSGQDGEDRLARAVATATGAGKKADDQAVENATRRLKRQRTEKLEKVTAKESKAQNFKGRHAPDVVKGARKAWDVYKSEIEGLDDEFVVPKWNAKGNGKGRGQVCELVDMYGGEATEQAIRYVVGNWDEIGKRFFKTAPGGVPNLGRLFALHEQLFREATVWGRHREVLEEWRTWFDAHRYDEASPPAGLQERYDQARTALESLGLGG